jgi:ABC-type glycerol-3-phosphate transport system substrate-binding protein
MKNFFKVIALTLMSFILISCGEKEEKTLTIATWKGGGSDFLEEIVELYKSENPNVSIEIEIIDNTQYDNNMKI